MRIAVSGSAGSGKTSLVESLAKQLELKIISEHYDDFFDKQGRYIKPPKKLMQKIDQVLDSKHQQELDAKSFIADRCPIDLFNLWMTRGYHSNKTHTDDFYKKCIEYLKKYDFIILIPWGDIPLKQVDQADSNRKRVMKPWIQFQHHSTIIGVAMQWIPLNKIIAVPQGLDGVERRCEYVMKALFQAPSS
jgi:GTPase SAR1 family protein